MKRIKKIKSNFRMEEFRKATETTVMSFRSESNISTYNISFSDLYIVIGVIVIYCYTVILGFLFLISLIIDGEDNRYKWLFLVTVLEISW